MPSVRDIFIRLGIKSDPRKLQRFNQGINAVRSSAIGLGHVFLTGAVALGFKKMIDQSSDIVENANKFEAVFGSASAGVQASLDEIRKRTGATNTELVEMAANIGALIKPSLGSAEAAGKMAASVTELALDVSSFNNVTSQEALTALRSGLIGSSEPMQRFGVDLRAAALELEAMRQGLGKSVKEMTEGERIQLRFNSATRQLKSQGALRDATKTAKGFANASRNLGAAMKETAGIVGTFFLKSVGGGVNKLRELVNGLQEWLAANRQILQQRLDRFLTRVKQVIGAVISVVRDASAAVSNWSDNLGPLGKSLWGIVKTIGLLAAILLLPGGSMLLLIGLVALLIEDFDTWRKGGESVIGDLVAKFKELMAPVEEYRVAVVKTMAETGQWIDDNAVALAALAGAVTSLAVATGIKLVAANAAAIASFVSLQAFALKYYAVLAAGAIKAAAIVFAAQLKMAAGFIIMWGPLGIAIALIGGLVAAIIYMLADLKKETGSWGEALLTMGKTAWEFWKDMFSELGGFIINQFLGAAFKIVGWLGKLGALVTGLFDDEDENKGKAKAVSQFFGPEGEVGRGTVLAPAGAGGAVSNNKEMTFNMEFNVPEGTDTEKLAEMIPPLLRREQEKEYRAGARDFAQGAAIPQGATT